MSENIIRDRLQRAGKNVGVQVYPHRLRHTCATQLLNAGCRVTSIQRFLGHKELGSTMVYTRAHDQTVAEDYFAAMAKVERRLEIVQVAQKVVKVVKVPGQTEVLQLIEQLEVSELCYEERLCILAQLRKELGAIREDTLPEENLW